MLDDYDTGKVKPPSQRRSSRSGQSGRRRKLKAPSLRSIPDPIIIPTMATSKFLIGLFELIYLINNYF